jgi:hypothetical protein
VSSGNREETTMSTKENVKAAINMVTAVAEAIRELREVPNGVLYAHVMGAMSMQDYESCLGVLKRAELVDEKNHVLRWVGPVLP